MGRKIIQLCVAVILIFSGWTQPALAASSASDITPFDLSISTDELDKIIINFHESSFQSSGDAADLTVKGNKLVSSKKSIPLSSAKTLLGSLHDMYPVPRFVTLWKWTDDYPYEQLILKLKDGRQVVAESNSQFPKGVPWNVRVWQGEPDKSDLLGSYVLLNEDFHAGANEVWKALTGADFPRNYGLDQFYWDSSEKTNTIDFYVPEPNDGFTKYGDQLQVTGLPAAVLEPYVPVLKQNPKLAQLFDSGFTLFDAAFDITVTVADMKPLWYSGMIALKAPTSPDVVVTSVKIELSGNTAQVTTPLTARAVQETIAKRQGFAYLGTLTSFLPGLVFLNDLRIKPNAPPALTCSENPAYGTDDFAVEALMMGLNANRITFYHLPQQKAWAMATGFDHSPGRWDDSVVSHVLAQWFPPDFQHLDPADLESLNTAVGLAFHPGVTYQKPQLIPVLIQGFPDKARLHISNPQKDGDMSFAALEGELIIPESGAASQMVYCGHQRADWEDPPYNVTGVKTPDPSAPRDNLASLASYDQGGWTPVFGLRSTATEMRNITFTSNKPGYLHLLWTTDQRGQDGIYYAEGWADGTSWIKPQRLGDSSWSIQAVSNKNGEVHFLWSTHYDPVGSMHVWRNAQGVWQKPEYWEGIGYFSNVLLDEMGNLRLAWTQFDGLDQEFFYAEWNQQTGLSKPENISRRLGDIGNNQIILREDAGGQIYAVWGHPLSGQQYIDPLSGEVFDQSGIFYSQRLRDLGWSTPEQIGVFAPFSYSLGFEFSVSNEPVVVWQSPQGIRASIRQKGHWTRPTLIQQVTPPATPAEFGPDRWGQATAEIQLLRDSADTMTAVWSNLAKGIYLSHLTGNIWQSPKNIVSKQGLHGLSAQSGQDGEIHVLYSDGNSLFYTKSAAKGKAASTSMGISYNGYGSDFSQFAVDEAGFVYVIGSPYSEAWRAFIPATGRQLIPTPQPTPNGTATSTQTPPATPTSQITSTPIFTRTPTITPSPMSILSLPSVSSAGTLGLIIVLVLVILAIFIVNRKRERNNQDKRSDL